MGYSNRTNEINIRIEIGVVLNETNYDAKLVAKLANKIVSESIAEKPHLINEGDGLHAMVLKDTKVEENDEIVPGVSVDLHRNMQDVIDAKATQYAIININFAEA